MTAIRTTPSAPRYDDFAGTLLRNGATLDPTLVAGRHVALVGEPRRVVRCVPHLAGRASILKLFQTDGVWVLPDYGPFGRVLDGMPDLLPSALRWWVAGKAAACNLRLQMPDAWTRRHLAPQADPGATTMVRTGGYYRSLRRDDVELVGWPIANVVPSGVRTADGIEHHVDVIVVA